MRKKLQTIFGLFTAAALHAQPPLGTELQVLAFQMRSNNLYHQLVWDFVPTNAYIFD